jgi:hypothetical protein
MVRIVCGEITWLYGANFEEPVMPSRLIAASLLAGAVAIAAQPEGRSPRNAAEFDAMFQQIKNWGRWGPDDQRGSANLITAAKRRQAASLAKLGETVSLAHNALTERAEDNSNPFEHTMLRGNNMDRYAVSYHGYAHSHIDALCHILYKDQTYNGYARADCGTCRTSNRARRFTSRTSRHGRRRPA